MGGWGRGEIGEVTLRSLEAQDIRDFRAVNAERRLIAPNEHHVNIWAKVILYFEGVNDGATDGWLFTMNEEVWLAHDQNPDYFPDYEYGGRTSLAVPWPLVTVSRILHVEYWPDSVERSPSGEIPRARPLRWEDSEASFSAGLDARSAAAEPRHEEALALQQAAMAARGERF